MGKPKKTTTNNQKINIEKKNPKMLSSITELLNNADFFLIWLMNKMEELTFPTIKALIDNYKKIFSKMILAIVFVVIVKIFIRFISSKKVGLHLNTKSNFFFI